MRVSEFELADARAEIGRLKKQVTRLQTDSTTELLKHRETAQGYERTIRDRNDSLAARDARIGELTDRPGEMAHYLTDAREFSSRTFGPGRRTGGVTKHIEKELEEIRQKPDDLSEWIDVIILGCDGYWRHGGQPEDLLSDMRAKLEKNKLRKWPTPTSEDEAVEHDRTHDTYLQGELDDYGKTTQRLNRTVAELNGLLTRALPHLHHDEDDYEVCRAGCLVCAVEAALAGKEVSHG